jgi:hypothetical protein
MKQVLISALAAALVSGALFFGLVRHQAADSRPGPATPAAGSVAAGPLSLHVTDPLVEDGWVNGARAPGADKKPLAHAGNSICYLTKIEIKGIQGPQDSNACAIDIDEFTGFWQVTASVAEGGSSEVRCNAQCLVWEETR